MDKHYQCLKTCTYFKEFGRKVFGRKIMKNSCRSIFPELTGTANDFAVLYRSGGWRCSKGGMLAFEEMHLD